jgi:DNA ligase-1
LAPHLSPPSILRVGRLSSLDDEMITSFFKKAPPAAAPSEEEPVHAAAPTDSAAKRLKVAAADGGSANKGLTPANNTNGGDKKARRRGVIDDSDDEMPAEVTPAPLASLDGGESTAVPMETERETAQEKPDEKATVPAAPPVTDADASAAVKPAAAKVASGAASSSSSSLQGPSSKAKEAESDEGEDDDEDDDEDEEAASDAEEQPAAADGPSSKKPLALKQAKSKSKSKASAKQGVTAASVAYHKYDVLGAATWKPGAPVPYLFLARVFGKIEDESKRLLITEMMANAFRTVIATSPGDLGAVMALATMRLAPAYEGIELGIGDSIMVKAVAETCGRSVKAIKADMEEVGDLGVVAMTSRTKQVTLCKPKALSVAAVLKTLKEIAQTSGSEAMKRKGDKIKTMLVAAQEKEAQYLVRSLQGKMRIGLAEQTALVALAHAFVLQHPCKEDGTPSDAAPCTLRGEALQERLAHAETVIKQVYSEMPNYDIIIPALVKHGIDKLHEHAQLTAGVPVKPMLAKPTKGIGEVLDRFSNCAFTCEFKYDGERAQIHLLEDGTVKIFSRNSEDNTTKYPDIAAIVPRAVKQGQTKSAILDAEAVAVDTKTGAILPFQVRNRHPAALKAPAPLAPSPPPKTRGLTTSFPPPDLPASRCSRRASARTCPPRTSPSRFASLPSTCST